MRKTCKAMVMFDCAVDVPRNPVEGEYFETLDGTIFTVIGNQHPQSTIISYPKYYRSTPGSSVHYFHKKLKSLKASYNFLRRRCPGLLKFNSQIGSVICEVNRGSITRYYYPTRRLEELTRQAHLLVGPERDTAGLANYLANNTEIPGAIGVTGSILLHLARPDSDVDLVVYGRQEGHRLHQTLKHLQGMENRLVQPFNAEDLKKLYHARIRDTKMTWKQFRNNEESKVLQGLTQQRPYYIRLVPHPEEDKFRFQDIRYEPVGEGMIRCEVKDASNAIFTPCLYLVDQVQALKDTCRFASEVTRIMSYRGRFCEIASTGDAIIAKGKIERIHSDEGICYQMFLGNNISDMMINVRRVDEREPRRI